MSDLSPEALSWIERYAQALDVPLPTEAEVAELLDLAGVAAHASHRQAAPVACWLAARAGLTPAEALHRATALS
jgi:hypothetical protein